MKDYYSTKVKFKSSVSFNIFQHFLHFQFFLNVHDVCQLLGDSFFSPQSNETDRMTSIDPEKKNCRVHLFRSIIVKPYRYIFFSTSFFPAARVPSTPFAGQPV